MDFLKIFFKSNKQTYHHLPSEELGNGSLNTSAFHFVFHVVQKLKNATRQGPSVIIEHYLSNRQSLMEFRRTHHSAQLLYIVLHEAI